MVFKLQNSHYLNDLFILKIQFPKLMDLMTGIRIFDLPEMPNEPWQKINEIT